MRILHFIQRSQLRGAEIFALQLSRHLRSDGNEVAICVLFDTNHDLDNQISAFKSYAVRGRQNLKLIDIRGWSRFNQIVRDFEPDLVQANAGDTLLYSALSKKVYGWRSKLVFRNATYMSGFMTFFKSLFYSWIMRSVDQVISVSENCRQDFLRTVDFEPKRTCTITIGIDPTPIVPECNLHKALGISSDAQIIVNVASLVPEKNHQGLLTIFKKINSLIPETRLIIVGDGILRNKLQQTVAELEIEEVTYFLGYRSDVLSILACCDVMVLPSRIEGLPGVILEAMSIKLPVVASRVGGIPELIENGINGFCIRSDSIGEYVDATIRILNNQELGEKIGKSARDRVVSDFDNRKICCQFLETYNQILQRT